MTQHYSNPSRECDEHALREGVPIGPFQTQREAIADAQQDA